MGPNFIVVPQLSAMYQAFFGCQELVYRHVNRKCQHAGLVTNLNQGVTPCLTLSVSMQPVIDKMNNGLQSISSTKRSKTRRKQGIIRP
jgi:hypothetical protein